MEQKTGIEKIRQHISECHQRIEQKQEMWRQAENDGDWQNSESLGKAINVELGFVNGLERALAYLTEDGDEMVAYTYIAVNATVHRVRQGENGHHVTPKTKVVRVAGDAELIADAFNAETAWLRHQLETR